MADNPLKYSDLLQPDDSIEKAISQLEKLNATYRATLETVKQEAIKIQSTLEGASGATEQHRNKIREATEQVNKLTKAQRDLEFAMSDTAREIAALKEQQREEQNISKLMAKLKMSEAGSYNTLSAQYSLNKIKLNKLSQEYRENTEAGRKLVKETEQIYAKMKLLQEATGKHTLNVGNYASAWDGLGSAANQLVRELPSLAVSANTFFLAISNNIPILIDEINRLKIANKAAAANGEETVPVLKSITKAFFSWNTLISLGITLLTVFGGDIINWVKKLIKGEEQLDHLSESMKGVNDAMSEGRKNAQQSIVRLNLLYNATQDVSKGTDERRKAIKALKREFPAYFKDLSDETILAGKAKKEYYELTKAIKDSAMARGAEDKIVENSKKILELEEEKTRAIEEQENARKKLQTAEENVPTTVIGEGGADAMRYALQQVRKAEKEVEEYGNKASKAQEQIDALTAANEELAKRINITDLTSGGAGVGRGGDRTQTITNKNLKITEELIRSNTDLIQDERERERQLLLDSYEAEKADLINKLENDKDLTEQSRENIRQIIINKEKKLQNDLAALDAKYAKIASDEEKKRNEERIKEQKELNRAKMTTIEQEYDLRLSEIDLIETTEREKTKLRLEAEKDRLKKLLSLAEAGQTELSETEIETLRNTLKIINKEIDEANENRDIYDLVGLKLDEDAKQAISDSVGFSIGQLKEILDAQLQIKEQALQAAQEEKDAAKSRLDAEIEARNNGYANDVATAQKELELAKQKEEKALREKQKAQRASQALDTLQQTSSLITASAEIWKALAGVSVIGPALAIAGVATMWGSFAAAKIKAREATRTKYGEGGMEFLMGGSHQSGNDIDLGTTPDGRQRRAEGGEAFAIFNKTSTRKYRRALPGIIKSINNGTFESKYLNAFGSDGISIQVGSAGFNSRQLESDVREIREQGKKRYIINGNGQMVESYKNLTRVYI